MTNWKLNISNLEREKERKVEGTKEECCGSWKTCTWSLHSGRDMGASSSNDGRRRRRRPRSPSSSSSPSSGSSLFLLFLSRYTSWMVNVMIHVKQRRRLLMDSRSENGTTRREQRERAPPGDWGHSPQHDVVVIVILVVIINVVVIIIIAARDRDLQKSRGESKEETGLIMERKTYLDNQTRKKKTKKFFLEGGIGIHVET